MPTVKSIGEPCAGEPHARFEVAARGNQASTCRAAGRLSPTWRHRPILFGYGAWIGKANLVPVVIAFGEKPVIPQLRNSLTERAVSADAGRMMSPGSEEAVPP